MTKKVNVNLNEANTELDFCVYSKLLQKPFDCIEDLRAAEKAYKAELKAKEDKAANKKADAAKVEKAFKALNQARRDYKESMQKLVAMYQAEFKKLQNDLDADRARVQAALSDAETAYSAALKEFTDKYDSYHFTMRDGDFETTMTKMTSAEPKKVEVKDPSQVNLMNIFDLFFGL